MKCGAHFFALFIRAKAIHNFWSYLPAYGFEGVAVGAPGNGRPYRYHSSRIVDRYVEEVGAKGFKQRAPVRLMSRALRVATVRS